MDGKRRTGNGIVVGKSCGERAENGDHVENALSNDGSGGSFPFFFHFFFFFFEISQSIYPKLTAIF